MSKNRSSARLDLYNSIRSRSEEKEPATLSSLLPPQASASSTTTPKNSNVHNVDNFSSFIPTNLTRIPTLDDNINNNDNNIHNNYSSSSSTSSSTNNGRKGISALAPRPFPMDERVSNNNNNNNNNNNMNENNNSVSLVASMFENESSSFSSKDYNKEQHKEQHKEQLQQQLQQHDSGYAHEEDMILNDSNEEGCHPFTDTNQSLSNSSSFLSTLHQQQSSDSNSSNIPHIPKSNTQPIAIARTMSDEDDSYENEYYYNYYNRQSQNYNTQSRLMNNYNIPGKGTGTTSTLIPPLNTMKNKKNTDINLPRPVSVIRMTSAPAEGAKKVHPLPPNDYIDSKDGHIWRAKYCILEDGVLYFYPTAEIGNSDGAQQERNRMSAKNNINNYDNDDIAGVAVDNHKYGQGGGGGYPSNNNGNNNIGSMMVGDGFINDEEESDHLAKSPMPRMSMKTNYFNAGGNNGLDGKDSFCHDPNVYWEKRVALDKVGNVRSNPDYGEKVFELLAINSEEERDMNNGEEVDRLLLRAASVYERNCWILEIHQSYIFLMKRYAEIVGSFKSAGGYLDSAKYRLPSKTFGSKQSLDRANSSPISGAVLGTSLSHGHGRGIRHRRTDVEASLMAQVMQLPQSPKTPSQTVTIDGGFINRARSHSHDTLTDDRPPKTLEINLAPSDFRSRTNLSQNMPSSRLSELLELSMPIASPKLSEAHITKSSNLNIQLTATTKKYIPPQKRRNYESSFDSEAFSEQVKLEEEEFLRSSSSTREKVFQISPTESFEPSEVVNVGLGGCADPSLINGRISDEEFIPEKASKVRQSAEKPFGYKLGSSDIGATSTCGVRDSNEDSYLVVNDLIADSSTSTEEDSYFSSFSKRSLFAIFDGHCGNHAARYSAENLKEILVDESVNPMHLENDIPIDSILEMTISRLDDKFCELCSEGKRDWFSGTTAIIALVLDEKLIVANVGDCRGILCCSSSESKTEGWEILLPDDSNSCTNENTESLDNPLSSMYSEIFWKEVASTHSPSHEQEKLRIELANGWTNNSEQEVTIASQFQNIKKHLGDEDVRLMFLRWFSDRSDSRHARILNIWRVCGDLAVSFFFISFATYCVCFNIDSDLTIYVDQ